MTGTFKHVKNSWKKTKKGKHAEKNETKPEKNEEHVFFVGPQRWTFPMAQVSQICFLLRFVTRNMNGLRKAELQTLDIYSYFFAPVVALCFRQFTWLVCCLLLFQGLQEVYWSIARPGGYSFCISQKCQCWSGLNYTLKEDWESRNKLVETLLNNVAATFDFRFSSGLRDSFRGWAATLMHPRRMLGLKRSKLLC